MSMSRSGALSRTTPPRTPRKAAGAGTRSGRRRRAASATVLPRDDHPEDHVQAAEPGREQHVSPATWRKEGQRAEGHESGPGHGYDAKAEHTARHEPGTIEKQPHSRQQLSQ